MALKETLLENKKLNEYNQFEVAERQSKLSYELGDSVSPVTPTDYAAMYDPFVKQYAEIQLELDNGSSDSPSEARRYADSITDSVSVIQTCLENILSNTEVWDEATQLAGKMNGVDLMGTPESRYRAMNVLSDNIRGTIDIKAVDNDIKKLAWEIYDEKGFIERMFLDKINKLSETQEMFVTIPDTSGDNESFKILSSEIFENIKQGEATILTGGVTETYRKKKEDGQVELITKDINKVMVQDFYIIDKEAIGNSLQFNTEMNKISAGLVGMYESSDQVIAFNNNILSEVTDHYIKPGIALKEKQEKRFQEDYKSWFLEREIGKEFPSGEPRLKVNKQEEETPVVEEEVVEEQAI